MPSFPKFRTNGWLGGGGGGGSVGIGVGWGVKI